MKEYKTGRLKSRNFLTAGCPEKETQHLILDISDTGLTYEPGDCVAILPEQSAHPRYYSISSSMKTVGDEIHLTVRHIHDGICTSFLCERAEIGAKIPLYIHKARSFKLPEDETTPLIMIGPGTGVAPYRAFMQERPHAKSWLFFGEWTRKHHFFYEKFWNSLDNLRLTTAFSRDQKEGVYVQDRLWEHRKELTKWLEEGATLYVCGDAKQMAKSVEKILKEIFSPQKVRELRKQGRYLRDIY